MELRLYLGFLFRRTDNVQVIQIDQIQAAGYRQRLALHVWAVFARQLFEKFAILKRRKENRQCRHMFWHGLRLATSRVESGRTVVWVHANLPVESGAV